ncbi:MAG TPA: D-glucuronyl C5-epimerase family protein [Ktedonobacteraceae bacterium]|nr:D-glucuronyl C5-epimerase family protein [Ktedonobacteraceae bacterium]
MFHSHQKKQTADSSLSPYPLDMAFALTLPGEVQGADGVPYHRTFGKQPRTIALYALAQWNAYLMTCEEEHRAAFLAQARWLLQHALSVQDGMAGWPVPIDTSPPSHLARMHEKRSAFAGISGYYFSATIQGCALSVLLRAYLLTREPEFLQMTQFVFETFRLDILDGGIGAPVTAEGLWFEEYALYPASHTLAGMLFALLGLYEYSYLNLTAQTQALPLFERAFATLHALLPEFDCGYWLRGDLLQRVLLTPEQFALHVQLLCALAHLTGDVRCTHLARRWQHYLQAPDKRLRYMAMNSCQRGGRKVLTLLRTNLFPRCPSTSNELRVCVPITAFPLTGGMRTILDKLEKSMQLSCTPWRMTYMTQRVGAQAELYRIQRFGTRWLSPRQFPLVWGYALAGAWSLFWSLARGASYDLILPQDGLFTAAFAAPLAHLAGIRVICIDHGNLATLPSELYRQERLQDLAGKPCLRRWLEPWLLAAYWPSLQLFARIAACFVDCYAIPGVPGDGIEEICRHLGIPPSRLVRFVNTIDVAQYCRLDHTKRAALRVQHGIAADAIVITTICRLSPEKGVVIALEALDHALSLLSPGLRTRVRFVIAGDGPLRARLQEEIMQRGLGLTCTLWGEISHADALLLHDLSDIYLYSGTRGGGYSLVLLEAMAAASAVLASDVPLANVRMLADERGLVVSAGDIAATAQALVRLIEDEDLRLKLGHRARQYVSLYNTEREFRRVWQRSFNIPMSYELERR